MDKEYILITFDEDGKIDAAAFYRAAALDGYKAGKARALIADSQEFQVYQLLRGEKGAITFTRVEGK